MHIAFTYLVDIEAAVALASPIYNSAMYPIFINMNNNRVINYIIRNHRDIKFIDSGNFLVWLTGGVPDPLPPSTIEMDKHPLRAPEFSVNDRYKNYLNFILKQYKIREKEKAKAAEDREFWRCVRS
jgi:hypothetical protein